MPIEDILAIPDKVSGFLSGFMENALVGNRIPTSSISGI